MSTKKKLLQSSAGTAAAGSGTTTLVDDVFATHLHEGNGAGLNIINDLNLGDNVPASVSFDGTGDSLEIQTFTWDYSTGDFTVEFWMKANTLSTTANIFDNRSSGAVGFLFGVNNEQKIRFYYNGVDKIIDTATLSTGTWYHMAVTRQSGTSRLFKDGSLVGSVSDTQGYTSGWLEIGQRGTTDGLEFDGYLSNVRVVIGTAVYTSAFTVPTEPLTAISGTQLLTCTGDNFKDKSSNKHEFTIKGNPAGHQDSPFSTSNTGDGGMVWVKRRDDAPDHHIIDTNRGVLKRIRPNDSGVEATTGNSVTSFNSNGFTLGSQSWWNGSGGDFVSWSWKKNEHFFDIIGPYTGDGASNRALAHNLNTTVGMVWVKRLNSSEDWAVWHRNFGTDKVAYLNSGNATTTSASIFGTTDPTSSYVYVGNHPASNNSGDTYIMYVFAHNNSDGIFGSGGNEDIIKCGAYSGNTSYDGPDIDLGFEPSWIMIKGLDTTGAGWLIYDTMRGIHNGSSSTASGAANIGSDIYLLANTSGSESTDYHIQLRPNGFKLRDTGNNISGYQYLYMAIRRPMKQPTSVDECFKVNTYTASGAAGNDQITDFVVDMTLIASRNDTTSWKHGVATRATDPFENYLVTSTNGVFQSSGSAGLEYDHQDRFVFSGAPFNNNSGTDNMYYAAWSRKAGFCDIVQYYGAASGAQSVPHSLLATPEMMWIKSTSRDPSSWYVYHKYLDATNPSHKFLKLDASNAVADWDGAFNDTDPTDTHFSVGANSNPTNQSGEVYQAILFGSLDGISKVGNYTGNGDYSSGQTINVGFPVSYLILKDADAAEKWYVFDVSRGIVSGTDKALSISDNGAEIVSTDYIDPHSSGFIAVADHTNTNGRNYIYYAVA